MADETQVYTRDTGGGTTGYYVNIDDIKKPAVVKNTPAPNTNQATRDVYAGPSTISKTGEISPFSGQQESKKKSKKRPTTEPTTLSVPPTPEPAPPPTPQSVVRPLTTTEKLRATLGGFSGGAVNTFKTVGLGSTADETLPESLPFRSPNPFRTAGDIVGLGAGMFTYSPYATAVGKGAVGYVAKGAESVKSASPFVSRAVSLAETAAEKSAQLKKVKYLGAAYEFGTTTAAAAAKIEATNKAADLVQQATLTPEEKQIKRRFNLNEVYGNAQQAQQEATAKRFGMITENPTPTQQVYNVARGLQGGYVSQIPVLRDFFGGRSAFLESVRSQLESKGATSEQTNIVLRLAEAEKSLSTKKEIVGSIYSNKIGEKLGRSRAALNILRGPLGGFTEKQIGEQVAKRTFFAMVPAGASEGVLSLFAQNVARRQTSTTKDYATQAGFGAVSAVAFDQIIQRTAFTNPKLNLATRTFVNIADPGEKPGDYAQDINEFLGSRLLNKKYPTPRVFTTSKNTGAFTFTQTATRTKQNAPAAAFTFTETKAQAETKTNAKQSTPAFTFTRTNINDKTNVFTGTKNNAFTEAFTFTNTQTLTEEKTNQPAEVPTETNTQTPTQTFVNINTMQALPKIGPPFIPSFGLGSGGGGSGRISRKGYVNETAAALAFFGVGGLVRYGKPKKASYKKVYRNTTAFNFNAIFGSPKENFNRINTNIFTVNKKKKKVSVLMTNKKGQVAMYILFFLLTLTLLMVVSIFAPMGARFTSAVYVQSEKMLIDTNDTVEGIQNPTVRSYLHNTTQAALDNTQLNIEVNEGIYKYGWLFILGISFIGLYLYTRRVVEVGGSLY